MLKDVEQYFASREEPVKSCLLALRSYILAFDKNITEAWKYRMPFYCYKGKMCCYLWQDKKAGQPYLGIVEGKNMSHPQLVAGNRSRMKIMLFDADKDIPLKALREVLKEMTFIYKQIK